MKKIVFKVGEKNNITHKHIVTIAPRSVENDEFARQLAEDKWGKVEEDTTGITVTWTEHLAWDWKESE